MIQVLMLLIIIKGLNKLIVGVIIVYLKWVAKLFVYVSLNFIKINYLKDFLNENY